MNSKDIKYLVIHGLEDEWTRLTVVTDLSLVHHLQPVALHNKNLLKYSSSSIDGVALLENYFAKAIEQLENEERIPFIIFDKKNGRYCGSTSFGNLSPANQRVEIGWTWLGREFQRTGLNRHAKYLMLSHAFEVALMKRVEFKSDANNQQSRMAMEAIGAKYEGLLRSHTVLADGTRRDTVYYSILDSEWPSIKVSRFGSIAD